MTATDPEGARVTGIVLAGGRSARFGRDKLVERLDGRTLLDRAVDALATRASEVLVVGPAHGPAPALHPSRRGPPIHVLRDPEPGGGPLVGLAVGLEAASQAIVLVAGGDMPALVPNVLDLLVDEVAAGAGAAALEAGGRVHPLPCALDRVRARAALGRVRSAGRSSVHAVLEALEFVAIPESGWRALDPGAATLLDVDRPADLDRAGGQIDGTVSRRGGP